MSRRRGWNGQVGKAPCAQCRRRGCTVMSDFTLLRHGPGLGCTGPEPDVTFYYLLLAAGLTTRHKRRVS